MTPLDPVRVGLVGLGRHMREVLAPTLAVVGGAEIVGVCDIDPEAVERFAAVFRVDAAFDDVGELVAATRPDVVLVAVGHDANLPILEAVLAGGAHGFVEKTPVATAADAERLARRQEETGRWIMAGFNRRFTDGARAALAAVRSPAFGGPHLFASQFHATRYEERAFLVNHIVHHLDLARFLLGELEPTDVQRVRVAEAEVGYAITLRASGSGALATVQAGSFLDPSYPVERVEVVGRGGNAVIDHHGVAVNAPPGGETAREGGDGWRPTAYRAPHRNLMGYEGEIAHLLAAVREGTRPSPDIADAVRTLRLLEAVMDRIED